MWNDQGIYMWFAGAAVLGCLLAMFIYRCVQPDEWLSSQRVTIAVLGAALGSFAGLVTASLCGLDGWIAGAVGAIAAALFGVSFQHHLNNWTINNIE